MGMFYPYIACVYRIMNPLLMQPMDVHYRHGSLNYWVMNVGSQICTLIRILLIRGGRTELIRWLGDIPLIAYSAHD